MAPPFSLNPEDYMNMDFGLDTGIDPEDSSLVRPSDTNLYEHGVPSPYQDKAMMLSSASAKAEDNAMTYLMQALHKQADISPEQGIATALLAAIPTFGGYMIGKHVGTPDLPAGYFEAGGTRAAIGLDKMGDPATQGALAGLEAGQGAAGSYLKSLDADQAQKNEVYAKLAQIEANKASRLQTKADSLEAQKIAREDNQAFQREILNERLSAQKDLATYKQEIKPEGFGAEQLSSLEQREAFNRISAGIGQPSDYSLLTPEAIKQANQNARSAAYAQSVANAQNRFETQQSYALANDTVVVDPMGKDPKLNNERAKIKEDRNMAKVASINLANSYDSTKGAFFGGDRKKEAAFASMLYGAARGLAGTGAQFSQNEKPLVDALSAPQMDINGFLSWFHDYLILGDPSEQARIVGTVLDKAFNEKLKGTGQIFKEYANEASGITSGGAPLGYDPQDAGFLEWKKRNGR